MYKSHIKLTIIRGVSIFFAESSEEEESEESSDDEAPLVKKPASPPTVSPCNQNSDMVFCTPLILPFFYLTMRNH